MSIPQQKFREVVFQILYIQETGQSPLEEVIPFLSEELSVSRKAVLEAWARAAEIGPHLPEIDPLIRETSLTYRFERIPTVERTILRLGVFELLFDDKIPPKVAIAEAVRLGRKFGTPESARFINALIDAIYKKRCGLIVDSAELKEVSAALEETEKLAQEFIAHEKHIEPTKE